MAAAAAATCRRDLLHTTTHTTIRCGVPAAPKVSRLVKTNDRAFLVDTLEICFKEAAWKTLNHQIYVLSTRSMTMIA
jgi:hypothetical protein